MTLFLVALGAALGAPLRYVMAHLLDGRLPWGTIAVNLAGSFLLGLFSGAALGGSTPGGATLAFLGTGFCGGLTTFSAFAVQTHDHGPRLGSWNVLLTVVPALTLCALGFWLGARA
ncbi:MAG TPA: CrcB family protein [Nocardioidaceae bacterium]|nr:CrcB family protein [Nocardioidaceae bacterium]